MAIRTFQQIQPKIHPSVYVDPMALVIGDVEIGKDSSIWPGTIVRGDVHRIIIGERTNVQDNTVIHVSRRRNDDGAPTHLGDDITVGHRAMLHGCTLQDRILVGMGAIIMDHVLVESDVIIGAGALVPPGKVLQSGFLYVGSPVKQARPLSEKEQSFLRISAENYVADKNQYLAEHYI